uniref:Putative heat shock factor protein hsf30 n=1 Tax=Triatoma infestans TaxID=30076 RepID=A0A023EZX7_TRIIF
MFSSPHSNPNVPAFIAKLWHMVSNPKSDNLISWNNNGTSFIIKNHARFSSELLPMYYKHNNMASFIRQLNKYGFHKVMAVDSTNNDKGDFEFAHPDFIRDSPAMLVQIKRKLTISKEAEYKGDSTLVSKLLQDVQQLQAKQDLFESKLAVLKDENDALWREQSILRQRHQKQQKIVNKLIQFLVTLVQQTRGLNMKRRLPLMLKDGTRPSECLIAIKDSGRNNSPLICEVDPYDVYIDAETGVIKTFHQVSPHTLTTVNNAIKLEKDNTETVITSPFKEEDQLIVNVPSTTSAVVDDILLEGQVAPSLTSNTSFAVPLQEVSPAIVQSSNKQISVLPATTKTNSNPLAMSRSSGQTVGPKQQVPPSTKKSLKRKHSSNRSSKSDCMLVVPDLSNDAKDTECPELHEDLLLAEASDNNPSNVEWDCSDVCVTLPTVTSPSGSVLICPTSAPEGVEGVLAAGEEVAESAAQPLPVDPLSVGIMPTGQPDSFANKDTSLVLSDLSPAMNKSVSAKEEIDNHLDMVQSDLDLLKDILHSEGLSLDASTLMELFSVDDPLSLNLPEAGRNTNEDDIASGNEVVAYSPNLMDMNDILDDETEGYSAESVSSPGQLNTPFVEFAPSPPSFTTSPSPSKRPKKCLGAL